MKNIYVHRTRSLFYRMSAIATAVWNTVFGAHGVPLPMWGGSIFDITIVLHTRQLGSVYAVIKIFRTIAIRGRVRALIVAYVRLCMQIVCPVI